MPHEGLTLWVNAACKAEELRWNDVESLADVLAHALHRLATFTRGVLGLDACVYAWQMFGQWLALGFAFGSRLLGHWGRLLGRSLQRRQPGLQIGHVGCQGLSEEFALLGAHALGLGAEAPVLQPRQLEGDLLDLRVAPLDGLGR